MLLVLELALALALVPASGLALVPVLVLVLALELVLVPQQHKREVVEPLEPKSGKYCLLCLTNSYFS